MLETAVGDGLEELGLEQEVAEGRRVDADIFGDTSSSGLVALLSGGGGSVGGGGSIGGGGLRGSLELLVGVVDKVLFG